MPTTGYDTSGVDIGTTTSPLYGFAPGPATGYQVNGTDLNATSAPLVPSGPNGFGIGLGGATGYKLNTTDLSQLLAANNSFTSGNVTVGANNLFRTGGGNIHYYGFDSQGQVWVSHGNFGSISGNTFLGYPITILAYEFDQTVGANATLFFGLGGVPNGLANSWQANIGTGTGVPWLSIEVANTLNGQKAIVNYSSTGAGGPLLWFAPTIIRDGNGLTSNIFWHTGPYDVASLGTGPSGIANANLMFSQMANSHNYLAVVNQSNANYSV